MLKKSAAPNRRTFFVTLALLVLCAAFSARLFDTVSAARRGTTAATPAAAAAVSNTWMVTNTNNSGSGSFRQAIFDANADLTDADTITFNIPSTDPNCAPATGVCTIRPVTDLPVVTSTDVTIDGFTQPGAQPNSNALYQPSNAALKIELDGSLLTGVNNGNGLGFASRNGIVRGLVINRFAQQGVKINSPTTISQVRLEGCYIGTDATGMLPRGNRYGVYVVQRIIVGGTSPAARNVISGNTDIGIFVEADVNTIAGNYIGVAADAVSSLGNFDGIYVNSAAQVRIGDASGAGGNLIAFNTDNGLFAAGNDLDIRRNSFRSNGRLGIDIPPLGFTPNDNGDADSGANNTQNFPELDRATALSGGQLNLRYRVTTATANAVYPLHIEFYLADADSQEGQTFIGADTYTAAQAESYKTINFTPDAPVATGARIVATATDSQTVFAGQYGNTSEFSPYLTVGGNPLVVTNTNNSGSGSLCQAALDANSSAEADTISFNIPLTDPNCNATSGVCTIRPLTNLPAITSAVIIDGFTQPGARPNSNALYQPSNAVLKVELDGSLIPLELDGIGLAVAGSDSLVRGLVINRFNTYGVQMTEGNPIPGFNSRLEGCYIGTDATGTLARGNTIGVQVVNQVIIGGVNPASRNVISGNTLYGINIIQRRNTVWGNYVGVAADGTAPVANGRGIYIQGGSKSTVGGATPGGGNCIAHNTNAGVAVVANIFNDLRGNSIHSNGGLGIDLNNDGVTPNDPDDADENGGNRLQNFPELDQATLAGNQLTVRYRVPSAHNPIVNRGGSFYALKIEFYLADADNQEGRILLGTDTYTEAEAQTLKTVAFTPAAPVSFDAYIVTTATDSTPPDPFGNTSGNTSEFSPAFAITDTRARVAFSQTGFGAGENQGPISVTVTRTGSTEAFSVSLTAVGDTATAGADFQDVSQTLNFAAGEMSKTISLALVNDNLYESEERAALTLSNPTNGVLLGEPSTFGLIIFSDDPFPRVSLSPSSLHVMEPATGTREATVRLRLSGPSATPVRIAYSTQDATANASEGDYVAANSETATFQPGQTEINLPLTINSDQLEERGELFVVFINEANGANTGNSFVTVTITTPVGAGGVLISEFRFRGPDSAGSPATGHLDEFIELYNNTDTELTVGTADGSDGWALVKHDDGAQAIVHTIPNGLIIPARGHHLLVNGDGYTLSALVGGDASYQGDIGDHAGLALFQTNTPANFTSASRLDAVGSTGGTASLATLFYEGTALNAPGPSGGEYSFARKLNSGRPQDTGDNTADFVFVSTDGASYGGMLSQLGAPGPENFSSPIQRNASLKASLVDPMCNTFGAAGSACARHRDGTPDAANNSDFGTLSIRRRFKNATGQTITRLRFRIVDVTAGTTQAGVADLRVRTSPDIPGATCTGNCPDTGTNTTDIRGLTLEAPSGAHNGGLNSTLLAGYIEVNPLAPGASTNVNFLMGVKRNGSFRFFVNVEALPGPAETTAQGSGKATSAGKK